jgi:hypothetical protein
MPMRLEVEKNGSIAGSRPQEGNERWYSKKYRIKYLHDVPLLLNVASLLL